MTGRNYSRLCATCYRLNAEKDFPELPAGVPPELNLAYCRHCGHGWILRKAMFKERAEPPTRCPNCGLRNRLHPFLVRPGKPTERPPGISSGIVDDNARIPELVTHSKPHT